jgi:hypothetical protein
MPFASSQWFEQNFFPAGAIQVQAMWAHLVGVFAIGFLLKAFSSGSPEATEFYSRHPKIGTII